MKVTYITAGAAGMYCGSCMHDNTLAAAMLRRGVDVTLVPLYTPIRTDEKDVSIDRVFLGGINAYLQEKAPFFRRLPRFVDGWLNRPWLIRKVAGGSLTIEAQELGAMTLSTLRGEDGNQAKEFRRLIDWIKEEAKPDLVNLTNMLIAGFVPAIRRELRVPVVANLQGDDLFLGELAEPYRSQALAEVKRLAGKIDAFIVNSEYYAGFMADLLEEPREKFFVTPLGVRLRNFELEPEAAAEMMLHPVGEEHTLGYLARISPEKGFDVLVDAFIRIRSRPGTERVLLRAAGWLGADDRAFFEEQEAKMAEAGLEDSFEYAGELDREEKVAFLRGLDVLSVPTRYPDPKGLYVLEALACGVPVVQPEHGGFPELIAATGGGRLVPPGDVDALASELADLLKHRPVARALGEEGRKNVWEKFGADEMARATLEVYAEVRRRFVRGGG